MAIKTCILVKISDDFSYTISKIIDCPLSLLDMFSFVQLTFGPHLSCFVTQQISVRQ